MITELDVDVLPLTKEGRSSARAWHPQFQLEEFEASSIRTTTGCPTSERQVTAR